MTKNPRDKITITERVNALILSEMAARGITRADLARELEVHPVTVTKALNSPARDWGITTLERWADALGCDLVIEFRKRADEGEAR